jgi:plastocyanin
LNPIVRDRSVRVLLFLGVAVLTLQLLVPTLATHSATAWQVMILGDSFSPQDITVNVGDSVTWVNSAGAVHSTVSNSNPVDSWNSGGILDGFNYTHVFRSVGTFQYYCDIHPEMTGSVTVQQPVPEFSGPMALVTLTLAIAAAMFLERGPWRRG